MDFQHIIQFWYEELSPPDWWKKNDELDAQIKQRFLTLHQQVVAGEHFAWRRDPMGRLAEIIVIDQFSRNIFRETTQAFAFDPIALILSQEAIACGDDQKIPMRNRSFLYMPFMHSESKIIHSEALKLFSQEGLSPDFEIKHKKIIDRFDRYPHRNKILGRSSTPEELKFLEQPDSSF